VSTRTYLSIGDVLSLLRQEFPDITISKIRFLESQGLVNPERSPSGYRKFYDHDVERLRWVLRQQREHFLPLKVIRDRLARNGGDVSADMSDFDADEEQVEEIDDEPAEGRNGDTPHGSDPVVRAVEPTSADEHVATAVNGSYEATADDEEEEWVDSPSESRTGALVTAAPLAPRVSAVRTAQLSKREVDASVAEGQVPEEPASEAPADPPPVTRPPRASQKAAASTVAPASPATPRAPVAEASLAPNLTGASLTLDELCAASGLGATEVASLEGFGLIEPLVVGGVLYYDEDGLTVAKLVADFARFGIEPRHLRLFRNAVDRELGLIEQVLTPLLRQRNPEARQRAVDAAGELSHLGQSLRGAILHRSLRHHLGG
jgi:DNA-binding transcriptional MerR regulator